MEPDQNIQPAFQQLPPVPPHKRRNAHVVSSFILAFIAGIVILIPGLAVLLASGMGGGGSQDSMNLVLSIMFFPQSIFQSNSTSEDVGVGLISGFVFRLLILWPLFYYFIKRNLIKHVVVALVLIWWTYFMYWSGGILGLLYGYTYFYFDSPIINLVLYILSLIIYIFGIGVVIYVCYIKKKKAIVS